MFKAVSLSTLIGYAFGCVNPAALISKIKKKNLREHGTKNLGASNVTLVFGKALGAFVMLFDIAKSFFAHKLAAKLFPSVSFAGELAGAMAIVGHCYPFYLKFKGGKGLAAYAGLILAHDPLIFLFLLITSVTLMIMVNQSYIMPFYSSFASPILSAMSGSGILAVAILILAGALIIYKHYPNYRLAQSRSDVNIRGFIKTKIFHKEEAAVADVTEDEQ